jgi:hypothetical protein
MKYKSVQVSRHGGPEILQVVENDLYPSAAGNENQWLPIQRMQPTA